MSEKTKDEENEGDCFDEEMWWEMKKPEQERLSGYFPAKILMVDTGEVFIAKTMQDIPASRSFKVLEVKIKEEKDE